MDSILHTPPRAATASQEYYRGYVVWVPHVFWSHLSSILLFLIHPSSSSWWQRCVVRTMAGADHNAQSMLRVRGAASPAIARPPMSPQWSRMWPVDLEPMIGIYYFSSQISPWIQTTLEAKFWRTSRQISPRANSPNKTMIGGPVGRFPPAHGASCHVAWGFYPLPVSLPTLRPIKRRFGWLGQKFLNNWFLNPIIVSSDLNFTAGKTITQL